jgi:hypothetical protein
VAVCIRPIRARVAVRAGSESPATGSYQYDSISHLISPRDSRCHRRHSLRRLCAADGQLRKIWSIADDATTLPAAGRSCAALARRSA